MNEAFNIICGELDMDRQGITCSLSIRNYKEIISDYDGMILKEIHNHIGILYLN